MKNSYFIFCSFLFLIIFACACISQTKKQMSRIDELAVSVSPKENREFSFTDKRFGYYYARTHSEYNDNWFSGWHFNNKRVFRDYELFLDGKKLSRMASSVQVYPHKLVRKYDKCTEELLLIDNYPVISLKMDNIKGNSIAFRAAGDLNAPEGRSDKGYFFTVKEMPEAFVLAAPYNDVPVNFKEDTLVVPKSAGGFILILGGRREQCIEMLEIFRNERDGWLKERKERMNDIVSKNITLKSKDKSLDNALPWLALTLDQLIIIPENGPMGIYAGLPWFDDYWGRDLFITLPGACLVTGQFNQARNILLTFSKYQNSDDTSKYYGRIPNRLRPDEVIYNTTDGTPRYIIEILDYIRYTGDTSIVSYLYPVIKRSIEGSFKYWVDDKGYLKHDDADTWMDAREKGERPYSPRGNRANDIQSLWYQQLLAGAFFAEYMNDNENAIKWKNAAKKVQDNFSNDFFSKDYNYMVDRISADGKKDFKLRPNQLYAFELLNNDDIKQNITKTVWESLVYPWGVASLSQMDPDFYPYHENWHYYHKDAAYHNGTVWLWNNGMAMQRMIEFGQKDMAYQLFKNMNRQALELGAIGSLSENADALPREGKNWSKSSGTFLQAWSNAEQLRVWYQYFLGIQPSLDKNTINVIPNIPSEITDLNYSVLTGACKLNCKYKYEKGVHFNFKLENFSYVFNFNLPGYDSLSVFLMPDFILEINEVNKILKVKLSDDKKKVLKTFELKPVKEKMELLSKRKDFFKDVQFCKPFLQKNLKSLQNYHEKELTY
jgi:glycogen debranching enzyme